MTNGDPRPSAPIAVATAFTSTADQLCSDAMAEQELLRIDSGNQITLGDRARLLVDLAPVRIQLAEDLGALDPPAAKKARFEKLVASAERRGVASKQAGARWERGAPRTKIAEAAAREHDERELAVEISRKLGLRTCGERLSRPEQEAVKAVAISGLSGSAKKRCGLYGSRLREQEYGSLERCRRSAPPVLIPTSATATSAEGMDEVFALVRVATPAGEYRVRITTEAGAYRIDKIA